MYAEEGGCLEPSTNGRQGRQASGSGVFLRKTVFCSGIVYHYSSIRVLRSQVYPGVRMPGRIVWCMCSAFSHTRFCCHQGRFGMPDSGDIRNVRYSNPIFSYPKRWVRIRIPFFRSPSYPRYLSQIAVMYGMQHL